MAIRDLLRRRREDRISAGAVLPWSHTPSFPRQPVVGPAVIDEGAILELPWSWRCITLLAGLARQMPVLDRRTREPAMGLWRRPTVESSYTTADLIDATMMTMLVHGVAYWRILERDSRQRPSLILPLHPSSVLVYQAPDVQTRTFRMLGVETPYTDLDIIQLRGPSMIGSLEPISPIRAFARTIAVGTHEQETARQVLEAGGIPNGYLASPGVLNPEFAARQAEAWYEGQGGRRSSVTVLDGGTEWKTVSMSSAELELVASRRLSAIEQCALFGVPPHLVGAPSEGHSNTYSNVSQDIQALHRMTLGRWTNSIEQSLRPYGLDIRLDESDIVRPNQIDRWNSYSGALAAGWLTIEEVREREGLPPLPAPLPEDQPEPEVEELIPDAADLIEEGLDVALS